MDLEAVRRGALGAIGSERRQDAVGSLLRRSGPVPPVRYKRWAAHPPSAGGHSRHHLGDRDHFPSSSPLFILSSKAAGVPPGSGMVIFKLVPSDLSIFPFRASSLSSNVCISSTPDNAAVARWEASVASIPIFHSTLAQLYQLAPPDDDFAGSEAGKCESNQRCELVNRL
jgi:hypothetical protein